MSTGPQETPTVDVHAHILLPALQQLVAEADPEGFGAQQALEVRRNGPESLAASGKMIKERWPQLTDLDRRLADMDAQGVDVQLVSPSPSHFYYFAGEKLSLKLAKQANQAVRDFVDHAPERLNGLGLVPLQHPALMVEALEHAVVECGLLGVEIGSFAPSNFRTRAWNHFGAGPKNSAPSFSCTRSAARWTNGLTASTSPTPSPNRPKTRWPCPT
jgi:aminocarboxymuconate-semialdehyde decarboxylase